MAEVNVPAEEPLMQNEIWKVANELRKYTEVGENFIGGQIAN